MPTIFVSIKEPELDTVHKMPKLQFTNVWGRREKMGKTAKIEDKFDEKMWIFWTKTCHFGRKHVIMDQNMSYEINLKNLHFQISFKKHDMNEYMVT